LGVSYLSRSSRFAGYAPQNTGGTLSTQLRGGALANYTSSRTVIRFGKFELDQDAAELRRDGTKIRLQKQPLQVLQILLEQPGKIISREELQRRIWPPDTFVDFDHGINNDIKKLREALGDDPETPLYIETLPRQGYRFVGKIEREAPRMRSLAVLPLEDLAHDPQQDYFADGLSEALITTLAKIGELRVVSRTSAMLYKGVHKPLREIAKELGVDAIVEGTVLRSGDRVRISAQLIDAPSDTHLWAESYERNLREVLSLQAEIASAISKEIKVKVIPAERAQLVSAAHQVDPGAYEAYLQGRYHWNKRTLQGLHKAREYFQQAIEKDPLYPAAHAGLADSSSRLGWWGHMPPDRGFGAAKAAALKALELDSCSSDAHAALGFSLLHYDCAFSASEQECRHGVELDSRNPLATQALACCLIATERSDEGLAEATRLVHLDPVSPAMLWTASALLYHARQYDRAIAQAHKSLELDPSFCPPRWTIALCAAATRSSETGISEMEEAVRATGENQFFLGTLGYCYARADRKVDATKVLDCMHELAKERYVSGYWPAVVCGALQEYDRAFELLEAAWHERAAWMAYAKVAPFLDDLRSDSRFDDLIQRMNFPAKA
jgi:TolB-like protein